MILPYCCCVASVVIGGILNFIPNFSPLLAMIPAVLVAFVQVPKTALILASMSLVIQVLKVISLHQRCSKSQ
jgi:predicted PurR-regulated permease PerM